MKNDETIKKIMAHNDEYEKIILKASKKTIKSLFSEIDNELKKCSSYKKEQIINYNIFVPIVMATLHRIVLNTFLSIEKTIETNAKLKFDREKYFMSFVEVLKIEFHQDKESKIKEIVSNLRQEV